MVVTVSAPKKPCAECPWRTDVKPGKFPAKRYVSLAHTAHDMAPVIFACHKSAEGNEIACAGFILRCQHNLAIRLAISRGEINPLKVSDGGYPLHPNYRAMAIANGVRPSHPALKDCRDD